MVDGKKAGGLAGISAGETALCTVGKEGAGLTYRGTQTSPSFDVDLAASAPISKSLSTSSSILLLHRLVAHLFHRFPDRSVPEGFFARLRRRLGAVLDPASNGF